MRRFGCALGVQPGRAQAIFPKNMVDAMRSPSLKYGPVMLVVLALILVQVGP